MTANERIAIALGWYIGEYGHIRTPDGRYDVSIPDYEHSLDALLEPLGVLRERGWYWTVDTYPAGEYTFCIGRWDGKAKDIEQIGRDLVPVAALVVADALEASK